MHEIKNNWFVIILFLVIPHVLLADLDIFVGRSCWLNTGDPNNLWKREQAWDIPNAPNGCYIHSSFCDLDNDGDYDVYITGDTDLIMAFENTGSKLAPVWQRKAVWDFRPPGMGQVFWADFVDLNGDGKCDLSVNKHDVIEFYRNTGTTPLAWTRDSTWDISVGACNLSPTYTDLDADGDYDVVLQRWFVDDIVAFENIGSATNPSWQQKTAWGLPKSQARPALGDLDGDGDADLLCGGWAPPSKAYENTGDTTNPIWTVRMGWLTPDAANNSGFYPEFIDIDGDMSVGIKECELRSESSAIKVYPNPFTKYAVIKPLSNQITEENLKIYDMTGQLVEETHSKIIGQDLSVGIYFVKAKGYAPLKIVKLK